MSRYFKISLLLFILVYISIQIISITNKGKDYQPPLFLNITIGAIFLNFLIALLYEFLKEEFFDRNNFNHRKKNKKPL